MIQDDAAAARLRNGELHYFARMNTAAPSIVPRKRSTTLDDPVPLSSKIRPKSRDRESPRRERSGSHARRPGRLNSDAPRRTRCARTLSRLHQDLSRSTQRTIAPSALKEKVMINMSFSVLPRAGLPVPERARGSAAVRARRSRLAEHGAKRRAHGLDGENRVQQ